VDQRQVPYGPEVSWPGGHVGPEYAGGDYRYPAQPQAALPASSGYPASANPGGHPYAAYNAAGYGDNGSGYAGPVPDFGYGDPGYSHPGYDGPSSQDAGVAGTRTVRGFVEPGYHGAGPRALPAAPRQDYPAQQNYPAPQDYPAQDYPAAGYGQSPGYSQPWDYDQPLRYDGEDAGYPGPGHPSGPYPIQGGYDAPGHPAPAHDRPAYDRTAYNGSEFSRPGIDGPGYDLSGIIGTSDFPAFGYDEPSVERLSYDDPRYADGTGHGQPGYGGPQGYDQQEWYPQGHGRDGRPGSRHDGPAFDDTRLDAFFGPDPRGYGGSRDQGGPRDHGGTAGRRQLPAAPAAPGLLAPSPVAPRPAGSRRSTETRLDLGFRALGMSQTRMDMQALRDEPRFDETRLDNLRAVGTGPMQARTATGLLARPDERPVSWPDETSLDSFAGLDLDDMPELREAPSRSRAVAAALREAPPVGEDTGSQRAVGGRRRGRSSDRRQWLALGAVAVVAVGAIAGVLSKFAFSGPSGPAHTISTPSQLDSYTRNPNLEKAMKVSQLRDDVMQTSAGQASNVVSALYSMGDTTPGSTQQVFMFVGGNLANSDPASSLASFEQTYTHAQAVPTGALGGQAACTPAVSHGEQVAMCVYFDNDSFGTFMSPSMSTTQLEHVMLTARPGVEQVAK
jgi:hypothetical protein